MLECLWFLWWQWFGWSVMVMRCHVKYFLFTIICFVSNNHVLLSYDWSTSLYKHSILLLVHKLSWCITWKIYYYVLKPFFSNYEEFKILFSLHISSLFFVHCDNFNTKVYGGKENTRRQQNQILLTTVSLCECVCRVYLQEIQGHSVRMFSVRGL